MMISAEQCQERLLEHQCLVQKQLVLANLKEAYAQFKERYPDKKIGFSKFAVTSERVFFLGLAAPIQVCVCTIHNNAKNGHYKQQGSFVASQ